MVIRWIIPPVGLIEPMPAAEFYVDDCGAIERVGENVRMHYYSEQMPVEFGGAEAQKIVMVKIVRPIATLPKTMLQIAHCLWPEGLPPAVAKGRPTLVT